MRNKAFRALVLVAAAAGVAAAAEVAWVTSTGGCTFPCSGDVAAITDDVDRVTAAYRLTWRDNASRAVVDFVEVDLYSWEVHCAKIKNRLRGYDFPPAALERAARAQGPLFPLTLVFYVTVGAYDLSAAELPNAEEWEVYLRRDGERQLPLRLSAVEGPYVPYNKKLALDPASGESRARDYFRKTYEVTFANEYEADPPAAIELVVAGRDAACGFAWRFEE
ncbi:MAG: hypothetical protein JSU81_02665 [Candidatus Coatesbacteria bacterium]|nr:MAG: hypothetical protein JSU81_02665 [Candidatus Coatesbacteria bacterium]